ncbi:MAG: type II toxin-antitoxin system CcdA family antitoxin [Candidatus Bathyarchaeota archaeon]|nr:type II toxin-antitoxin system CcdA family antitoxin [Candidatus Bathyarchaeota archaeon]
MGKKVVTSIRIDKDILRTAKELGLSVSKISENALKEAIRRLQTPVQQTEINGGYIDSRKAVPAAMIGAAAGI